MSPRAPVPWGPALLLRPLGVGGSGEVWLARWRSAVDDAPLVLKRFTPSIAVDIDDILDTAARLRGQRLAHVSTIFDAGVEDERAWVASSFVDGIDARALLATLGDTGLDIAVGAHIAHEALLGLMSLHARGLAHRDVTPANLMIDRSGHVVVVDLDFACVVGTAATGTVPGTVSYMSPEQAQGLPVDARADHYVWAIVAYELLVGDPFYGDLHDDDVLTLARTGGYRPRRFSSLPTPLRAVLHKALAPDPTDRFANDAALLATWSKALSASMSPAAVPASSSLAAIVADMAPVLDDAVVVTTPAWTQQQDHALRADYSAVDASSLLPVEELSTSVFRPRGGQGRRGLAVVVVVLVLLALVLVARAANASDAKPLSVSTTLGHAVPTCWT